MMKRNMLFPHFRRGGEAILLALLLLAQSATASRKAISLTSSFRHGGAYTWQMHRAYDVKATGAAISSVGFST